MSPTETMRYLALWGATGCALLSVFVIVAFRTSFVYAARREDALLKERVPATGVLAMLTSPVSFIALQVVANTLGLVRRGVRLGFRALYIPNFAHYLILFLYDTLVIDGIVLSVWRPGFLNLPGAMGREATKRHVLVSVPVGSLLGAILTAISTGVSYVTLFAR
jgi:hypothetical protein